MIGDKPPAFGALAEAPPQSGKLVENILHFARTLRAAGLPVGPGKVLQAIRAVEVAGVRRREDFYWALHAVLVNRRDQREIFDQTFHVFWRNPKILEKMMGLLLPDVRPNATAGPEEELELSRRVAEALKPTAAGHEPGGESEQEKFEVDATMTWSGREVLQKMDFEKMSAEELSAAKTTISRLRFSLQRIPTRRFVPHPGGGRADLRRTLRAALRSGSDTIPLRWRRRRRRHPPLVVLCDISGSMDRYSRMALHFMHAVTNDRDRVHTFLFGTRLSNITRFLRQKDVDVALQLVSKNVVDWSGGTRIGACLHDFNKTWARRVLGQGAILLFISDGLDRDNAEGLAGEMERLHKSCRRLIWLNPLLRYEGYEPRSLGAQAIMPHVDEFRPVYNLDSLAELAEVLSRPITRREEGVSAWLDRLA